MGTLTSFFGGGGGAAAIPNASYDSIRKATYKGVLAIRGADNPTIVPMSDTTFAVLNGTTTQATTAGHYTINDDGTITEDLAPLSSSLGAGNLEPQGATGVADHLIVAATNSSVDGYLAKLAWNGTSFTWTNISTFASSRVQHFAGTCMLNGVLIAVGRESNGTGLYAAAILPDGTTKSSSFASGLYYGDKRRASYCGAADGVYGFGRPSASQSSTVYEVSQEVINLATISGNDYALNAQTHNTTTNNTAFAQISSTACFPTKTSGAHWFAVDGNARFAGGLCSFQGSSFGFSQSPAAATPIGSYINMASDRFTASDYSNWRQQNGTVMDGRHFSLTQINEAGNIATALPGAYEGIGLTNYGGKTIDQSRIRTAQVGKYLITAGTAYGQDFVVLNTYEVE